MRKFCLTQLNNRHAERLNTAKSNFTESVVQSAVLQSDNHNTLLEGSQKAFSHGLLPKEAADTSASNSIGMNKPSRPTGLDGLIFYQF